MRQVPAVRELHAEHGIAGLEEGQVHGQVGRRSRVRLHIGVLGAEQGLGALDGQALDLVDDLLALVVARAGIAFGILREA